MINLLPAEEKEALLFTKNKKLTIILGSAILIAVVCLILVLLSVKFYILGEDVSQKFILEQAENRYKTSDFLNYKSLLANYNKKFSQLKSFYSNKLQFSSALKNILDIKRPDGVYFSDLSLDKNDRGRIIVKLSGISDTRDSLLLFKKNIEESKEIKNPNFPPESWINSKDINFYLTFEMN